MRGSSGSTATGRYKFGLHWHWSTYHPIPALLSLSLPRAPAASLLAITASHFIGHLGGKFSANVCKCWVPSTCERIWTAKTKGSAALSWPHLNTIVALLQSLAAPTPIPMIKMQRRSGFHISHWNTFKKETAALPARTRLLKRFNKSQMTFRLKIFLFLCRVKIYMFEQVERR